MIAIDNKLISDEVLQEHFVCDLSKCKGGCCEEGDAGAPLTIEELDILANAYEAVKPFMTQEGIKEVERKGKYIYDREFGWVTPTIGSGICAYGFRDNKGVILCAIEQSYYNGQLKWKKPISCHLYPIKISKSKQDAEIEFLNYEPRETLCNPACVLGKKLKMPVYKFLKEAIVRKYGETFYEGLEAAAEQLNK